MAELNTGPFSDRIVGYCTNVHAGGTLIELVANLAEFTTRVRQRYCPQRDLPIGLWFAADVVEEMRETGSGLDLNEFLWDRHLVPFTINGFPYQNFHEPVVKHEVYRPNWLDERRSDYTISLTNYFLGHEILGGEQSVSTLPIGWKTDISDDDVAEAVDHLCGSVLKYEVISRGKDGLIHLDLEPEPGCFLETSRDVVSFFERYIFNHEYADSFRIHLRVCHDICHAAVMFEDQAEMFRRYDDADIKIGKVQVSNAIRVDFDALSEKEKPEALRQLKAFEEDRYLHQTCIRDNATGAISFHEDLPLATKAAEERGEPIGEWRVHFHVPIYLESFGLLGTTRRYIDDCLELMKPRKDVKHFEVETYAWNVLPKELQKDDLAEGIADELIWLRDRMEDKATS